MKRKFFYIIIGKKLFLQLIIFFVVGIFGISVFANHIPKLISGDDKFLIVIDAGHGLPDGGAVGVTGIEEQEINLAISKKLEEILSAKGFVCFMTRNTPEGLGGEGATIREKKVADMKKRKNIIDSTGADVFLSIHINFFPQKNVRGVKAFYTREFEEAKALSHIILEKINKVTDAKISEETKAEGTLFLMKSPEIPGVLLECGFLSNPEEEALLKTDEYQSKIAYAIAEGVEEYFFKK